MNIYYRFPPQFFWGASTSAYQIEGAWNEDGRGVSIWDRFTRLPGKVLDGSNGDVACDHYHQWQQDIRLMKDINLNAYHFSISWPRILPDGFGKINTKGIDFYSRLVDGLLEAGITPFATLFHWDLPVALHEKGGWTNRATAEAFAAYAEVISRALGDRVFNWATHNEPWCASFLSYTIGEHAPGYKDWAAGVSASHHVLLSHGWSVPLIRQNSPQSQVGIILNFSPSEPASRSEADYQATRRFDGYFNRWFLDPLYGRQYPADTMAEYLEKGYLDPELIQPGDYHAIAAHMDFLGVNYYTRSVHRAEIPEEENQPWENRQAPKSEWTDMEWEVYPPGIYNLLCRLHFEYQIPLLYVTENGASYGDAPDAGGRINDRRRIYYIREHLVQVHKAIQAGVPVAGYFYWSLLDNFEWAKGYTQRFGLVWVDYETQERIVKDSALWYGKVCADNGFG